MAYVAVAKALYDYEPQASDELKLLEDVGLYIVDASDPEWWKAKIRPNVSPTTGQVISFPSELKSEEGKVGLVPANYVEEAEPIRLSRALYDYEAQNQDELSIQEDELLRVYELEGEWLLVKKQGTDELGTGTGKIGFVPANYVDEVAAVEAGPTVVAASSREAEEQEEEEEEAEAAAISAAPPMPTIAVKSAGTSKSDDIKMWAITALDAKKKKKKGTLGIGNASLFFASESDKAPVQKIPVLSIQSHSVEKGKTIHFKVNEDVETELAVGDEKDPDSKVFVVIASSKSDAEAITKKLDLSKSVATEAALNPTPTAASATKTNGAAKGAGGRSIPPPMASPSNGSAARAVPAAPAPPPATVSAASLLPPPSRKIGATAPPPASVGVPPPVKALRPGEEHAIALYDFDAQGDDELSVTENEKLVIVEKENEDWWKVRNQAGKEGVVPASYVEAVDEPPASSSAAAGMSQDRDAELDAEEEELRRQEEELAAIQAAEVERQRAARAAEIERRKREVMDKRRKEEAESKRREVLKAQPAPAVPTSERSRGDRVARNEGDVKIPSGRSAPDRPKGDSGRAKPSANNTRVWHDKSGQFKVEAEFLGFNKGKLRLHKINGVVIEVAIEKMSHPDIQFLEDITGKRLMPGDDDLTLNRAVEQRRRDGASSSRTTADRDAARRKEAEKEANRRRQDQRGRKNVDWFEFFLAAGVDVDDCTRYAAAFERDKIDESILKELDSGTLRSLGLREGDIIRVSKFIEKKYKPRESGGGGRDKQIRADEELARKIQEEEQNARRGKGSSPAPPQLFSGPDGSLKNNTRRGRPAGSTSRQGTSVDPASLAAASESLRIGTPPARSSAISPEASRKASAVVSGFDDDAWTPRPPSAKPMTPVAASPITPSTAPAPAPVVAAPSPAPPAPAPPPAPVESPKPQADPNSALFEKLAAMKPASPASNFDRMNALPNNGSMLGAYNGPRGPLAPVAGNQPLLSPLIPTQGTGQFVPTRQMGMQPQMTGWGGGMQPQATGWNGGMQPQQTGWGGIQPQSPFNGMQAQPTGFNGMQPQATGFNGMQPQSTGFNGMGMSMGMNSMSTGAFAPQPTGFGMQMQQTGFGMQQQPQSTFGQLSAQAQKQEREKDTTPQGIFAQMRAGGFQQDEEDNKASQPAERYDALRGFQTGGVLYPQQTGYPGYQ